MKKLFEKAVAVIALIALAVTAFPFTAPIKAETSRTELVIEPNAAVLSSDAHWEAEPVRENAVVPVRDAIWDGSIADGFSGGIGTEDDPYLISNGAELAYLAQQVNNGTEYDGAFFCLTNDIYLNDTTDWENWGHSADPANRWTPIGTGEEGKLFKGIFDGNGYSVRGIYIRSSHIYQSLFGFCKNSIISNLEIAESFIGGRSYVGGIVGCNDGGVIINCNNTAMVKGQDETGGIAGINCGTIINCNNAALINGENDTGGIAGCNNNGIITNCSSIGAVYGTNSTGGIAGCNNNGLISTCNNIGAVDIEGWVCVGGIAGYTKYEPQFAQLDESGIMDCYNVATVYGSMCIGGITGQSDDSTIRNCYNAGMINEGEVATGGVAGHANNNTVFNCYWLEASCIYDEYATLLTDEEMHYAESFAGFDFETVWTMDGNPAYPYPELINNPHFYADTPGDVNGDGFITAADANIAMRMALSLVEFDLAGDANGDGIVNAADANIVMRWALGL